MTKKSYLVSVIMALLVVISVTGCGGPAVVTDDDTVKVHYTGRLTDGTVFDTSIGSDPLEFTLGQGQTIPGFKQAVIGMQVGETKTVTIPADQAYGPHRDDMILEISKDELPEDLDPEVGMQLQMNQGDSGITIVTITEVSETTIRIDANHPLAGQDLTFNIELVDIGKSQSSSTTSQKSDLASMPLEQALSTGLPTLAEFGRGICVPCKAMKPILEELANEYSGKLNVVIVEIDDHMEQAREYEIMAIPTQIFFDSSGREITRHMGFYAKDDIIAQLKEIGIK
ncbi:FKBP-type peptidyl-prolyl cis-trans isomerase [Chloroflexota bacterium]